MNRGILCALIAVAATLMLAGCGSSSSSTATTATATTYSIGGTVTGLTASGLVLYNNGGDALTVPSAATTFTFATKLATGSPYTVTVYTQPTGLTCTVGTGTGSGTVANSNIIGVSVLCTPSLGTWTSLNGTGSTSRLALASAAVGGKIYAMGGQNANSIIIGTVEAYDPSTNNAWVTKTPMITGHARRGLAAAVVSGIIYAIGGAPSLGVYDYNEAYDPSADTWTAKTAMIAARTDLSASVVNGIIYAIGGYNGSTSSAVNEAYDPIANSWTAKASMSTARRYVCTAVANGIIYALGGYDGSAILATVEAYDPAANTWTAKASMSTGREGLTCGAINGLIYAVGGFVSGTQYLNSVEVYDPTTNTWRAQAAMPTDRAFLTGAVVGSSFYAIDGCGSTSCPKSLVEGFTP